MEGTSDDLNFELNENNDISHSFLKGMEDFDFEQEEDVIGMLQKVKEQEQKSSKN